MHDPFYRPMGCQSVQSVQSLHSVSPVSSSQNVKYDEGYDKFDQSFDYESIYNVKVDVNFEHDNEFETSNNVVSSAKSNTSSASFYPSPVEEKIWMPNNGTYNFLLVDDNEINLRILLRMLRKLFPCANVRTVQESHTVETSEDALLHYDIIFLDIEMPKVTGTEIATKIRLVPQLDHVALVAVTTRCMLADMELYRLCGFDLTFRKPLENHNRIQDKVEQVLDSKPKASRNQKSMNQSRIQESRNQKSRNQKSKSV